MTVAWMVVATAIFVCQAAVTVLIVSELRSLRRQIAPSTVGEQILRTAEELAPPCEMKSPAFSAHFEISQDGSILQLVPGSVPQ